MVKIGFKYSTKKDSIKIQKSGQYKEGVFKVLATDQGYQPVFLSRAVNMDQHKLLTEEERKCLPADAFLSVSYLDKF